MADTGGEPRDGGRKWGLSFSSLCVAPLQGVIQRDRRAVNEYLVGNADF